MKNLSRPWLRKFPGFTFSSMYGRTKIRIHSKAIERFKEIGRELTDRNCGKSLNQIIEKLNLGSSGFCVLLSD